LGKFCRPSARHASSNVNVFVRTACDYCNATCIVLETAIILNVADMLLMTVLLKLLIDRWCPLAWWHATGT
jgi:hypothetical protein